MKDENSANKFIKIMQEGFPGAVYRAVMNDGKAFKSKGYNDVKMKFESTMSKKLKEELENEKMRQMQPNNTQKQSTK